MIGEAGLSPEWRGESAKLLESLPDREVEWAYDLFSVALRIMPISWRVSGGAEGDRTPDLGIANAALSQLSYCP